MLYASHGHQFLTFALSFSCTEVQPSSSGSGGVRFSSPESAAFAYCGEGWQAPEAAAAAAAQYGNRGSPRSEAGASLALGSTSSVAGHPQHAMAPQLIEDFLLGVRSSGRAEEDAIDREDFDEADLLEWDDQGRWYTDDLDGAVGEFPCVRLEAVLECAAQLSLLVL